MPDGYRGEHNIIRDKAIDGNVIVVACTLKNTVHAVESSQYDCFRKPAACIG